MGWQVFKFLARPMWWRNSFKSSLTFAPRLVASAIFYTATILISSLIPYFLAKVLVGAADSSIQMTNVLIAIGGLLAALVVCTVCIFIALGGWLTTLTAFVHSFLKFSPDSWSTAPASTVDLRAAQSESIEETKKHTKFLTKYWLWATVVLIPLFVLFGILAVALLIQVPVQGQPQVNFGQPANAIIVGCLALSVLLIAGSSFVFIVCSAKFDLAPSAGVRQALATTVRTLIPCMILSALTLVAHTILTSPAEIPHLLSGSLASANEPLPLVVVSSIWQGAATVILLTLFITPFCELSRHNAE